MKIFGWQLVAFATAFGLIGIAACVGDDPESAPAGPPDATGASPGEYLGPCTAAGACNGGLVCFEGICHLPQDAGGGSDAGTTDADAGPLDTWCLFAATQVPSSENPCPSSLNSSGGSSSSSSGGIVPTCSGTKKVCCLAGDNICTDTAATCIGDGGFAKPLACSGGDTCGLGQVCCVAMSDAGTVPDAAACPISLTRGQILGSSCVQGGACGAGSVRVCRTDAECTAPARCRQYEQRADDPFVALGMCL